MVSHMLHVVVFQTLLQQKMCRSQQGSICRAQAVVGLQLCAAGNAAACALLTPQHVSTFHSRLCDHGVDLSRQ